MAHMVQCVRYKKELEGLEEPPFDSELGQKVYLPQLLLLEAANARAHGHADAGAAAAGRALDEARSQQAPWFELHALVDLCEHGDATAEDRRTLAALVDRLPEAVDTHLVRMARSLGAG